MTDNKELQPEATIRKYLIVQIEADKTELVTNCDRFERFKPFSSVSFNPVNFEAVKNETGSEEFRFQLSEEDEKSMSSQFATSSGHGDRLHLPYVFTEQGVAMLSAVLPKGHRRAGLYPWRSHQRRGYFPEGAQRFCIGAARQKEQKEMTHTKKMMRLLSSWREQRAVTAMLEAVIESNLRDLGHVG